MNTRRPTAAAGERWRKWVDEQPTQLDPDPLTIVDDHGLALIAVGGDVETPIALIELDEEAFEDGYAAGRRARALGYAAAFVLGGFVVALGMLWIRTAG